MSEPLELHYSNRRNFLTTQAPQTICHVNQNSLSKTILARETGKTTDCQIVQNGFSGHNADIQKKVFEPVKFQNNI